MVNCTGHAAPTSAPGADPLFDDLLHAARRRRARPAEHRRAWASAPRRAGSSTPPARPTRRSGRSARYAAASCGSRPPIPEIRTPGRAGRGRRARRGRARCRDGSPTAGWSAATTRSPGRATRSGCRCRPRPRRPRRTTPASSALMRLQSGGDELLREAAALDPDFAARPRRAGDARPRGRGRRRRRGVARGGPRGRPQARPTSASAAWSTSSAAGSRDVRHSGATGADEPHRAAPARRPRGVGGRADDRVLRRHRHPAGGVGAGRGTGAGVRRPLVVHLAARLHPAGPVALRRRRTARRERAVVRADVRVTPSTRRRT